MILAPEIEVRATRFGGTGIDYKSLTHTQSFPHRLDTGPLNLMGILGLSAGLDSVFEMGLSAIHAREMELPTRLREGLASIAGIRLDCADDLRNHVGLLTATVADMAPEDIGAILDAHFGIAVRSGLHCAPMAHHALGTYPHGGVCFSLGAVQYQRGYRSGPDGHGAYCRF